MITIIALLAAILFPVFAKAREKARQTACLSNMKQIGLAIMQYTSDKPTQTCGVKNSASMWANYNPPQPCYTITLTNLTAVEQRFQ